MTLNFYSQFLFDIATSTFETETRVLLDDKPQKRTTCVWPTSAVCVVVAAAESADRRPQATSIAQSAKRTLQQKYQSTKIPPSIRD